MRGFSDGFRGIGFRDLSGTERLVSMQEGSVERFEHLFAREAKVWRLEQERLAEESGREFASSQRIFYIFYMKFR